MKRLTPDDTPHSLRDCLFAWIEALPVSDDGHPTEAERAALLKQLEADCVEEMA